MSAKKKVGLFFGSFNPVHIGHMAMANYFLEFSDLEEVWFVPSPQSPHKSKSALVDPWLRLEMLHLAVGKAPGYSVSDLELYLPQPSYTSITMAHFTSTYPSCSFALIMGADNYISLHKWFNYKAIIELFPLYVYPRPGSTVDDTLYEGSQINMVKAPLMEISSSVIRKALKENKDMRFFLPEKVHEFICKERLYQ